ncbi:hypothetical protein GEV33_008865 [Tenebrio molitor]|uniref:Uncharacterized protein n=1 Tax=Tenebrio molitor TaxID=7067 RepID=A0A8J6HGW2_TENMO|nr:hypothetical protein GEV33_008865 [Tenebrio molitor]
MATIEKTDATGIEMGLNTRELIACSPEHVWTDRRWFYVVTVKDRRPLPLMDEQLDRLGTLGGNRAGRADRREPYLLHLVLIMNFYVFEHLMNNVLGPLRGTVVFPHDDCQLRASFRALVEELQCALRLKTALDKGTNYSCSSILDIRKGRTREELRSHRVEYEVKDLREKGLNQNTVVAADKTKGWDNSANSRAELPGADTARRKWGAELPGADTARRKWGAELPGADTARRKWGAELPGADTARRKCLLSKLLYEAMC